MEFSHFAIEASALRTDNEMSAPSKSQSRSKNSSRAGSVCPPTARSPSLTTATATTDPSQIPTALGNSVNTAIGATPSDFETNSGMSDTSAGSSRATSNGSEPRTAKSPSSPEKIMQDLKRGSLFGRSSVSQSQPTEGPQSVTHVSFSDNTNVSTASEAGSVKEKENLKVFSPNVSTGNEGPRSRLTSCKKDRRNTSNSTSSVASRKKMKKTEETSGKSVKSTKKSIDTSGKSAKSSKFSQKSGQRKKKPKKEEKEASVKFGQSGVIKKGDNKSQKADGSVYFPGVAMQSGTNGYFKKTTSASRKPAAKGPAYNFPGTGRYARSMDSVAPPPPVPDPNNSHCVYDVAELGAAQRRVPPPTQTVKKPPASLFGTRKAAANSVPRVAPKEVPAGNKMIVFGVTPDGKTTVQMTIDLQVVAGEALGASKEPVALVPKKIIVKGKEIPFDSNSMTE
ncbi:unnamed protein product [Caenorhabditis sp. 36 PRJEB53466]|nr:unnamed protein product [Caenorhabditis sp. 36 PRJEB53466]